MRSETASAGRGLPAVAAVVPAYRDLPLLRRSLALLLASEGVALDVIVVNNDPAQGVGALAAELGDARVRVLEPGRNTGFARACNLGIAAAREAEFVFLGNDDLFVTPGFLATLAQWLRERPRGGAAGGRLLRYDLAADRPTDIIDSAGVAMGRDRRAYDRGEGERDRGQFDRCEETFGISGAALFARRAALEDVRCGEAYLDDRFFMYKEDVDLCWRLRLRGWECWYVPAAIAYHGRTSRGLAGAGYLRRARAYASAKRRAPAHVAFHSLRNQWLMLMKNEQAGNALRDAPWIAGREALVAGYTLATRPGTFVRAVASAARLLLSTLRARREIQRRRTVSASAMRRWFRE